MTNIRNKIKGNRKIVENFSYLSILQIFNMLLPLITYPYLIRVFGAELYGTIIFAQTIIGYFSIVLNYGFEASATKDISVWRNDKAKISEIVSSAYIIKGIFWLILLLILLTTVNTFSVFNERKSLYLFSFLITFNELLFPIWYFQGLEKMKYITFINIFVRTVFLVMIFIFIKQREDYLYVPLLHGIGALIGGVIALYIVFVKDEVLFVKQSFTTIRYYLTDNLPIFFSNLVLSVKDRFNVIFIGSMLGMHDVAAYDLGIKVKNVFTQPITVANRAIYPKVARERNMTVVKKFIMISFVTVLMIIVCIQPFLRIVLDFLSNNLSGTITVARVLLISPIIMAISLPLARNCITALGKYKYLFRGTIYTTLFYLMLLGIMFVLNIVNMYLFAVMTVFTYVFELIYRLYICKSKIISKLNN